LNEYGYPKRYNANHQYDENGAIPFPQREREKSPE
jgi:hypothetical protein